MDKALVGTMSNFVNIIVQTSMSKLEKTSCHPSPSWGWGCFVTIEPLHGDTFVTFSAKNWEQCGQRPDSVLAAASGAIGKWADCQQQSN